MSVIASTNAVEVSPTERLDALFEELAELAGQRNAIDGRIVGIVAEVERDELWGATGARSVAAFPRCARGMREGRLSLDQLGVIAQRGADGSDEHYAELAASATVNQLRTAVKLEPRPDPDPRPQPQASITKTTGEELTCWRITLPHVDAATFDAGCSLTWMRWWPSGSAITTSATTATAHRITAPRFPPPLMRSCR